MGKLKTIKEKSVGMYIKDEFGGLTAVSKNAITRVRNKMKKGFVAGEVFSMPVRMVEKEDK